MLGEIRTIQMQYSKKTEDGKASEDWLALFHAPGLTPNKTQALLEHFGDARAVREACVGGDAPFRLARETTAFLRAPASAACDADLRWLDEPLNRLVPRTSPDYPAQFEHLPGMPPVLFVRGDVGLLNDPQVAVVGARTPTPSGEEHAAEFTAALARKGLVITSGLARGVDARAHLTALKIKAPTLAVVATGLNLCYPKEHAKMSRRIVDEGGALVSEFTVNAPPRVESFPRRNRIISALSLAVLVVEAGAKSGALITARLAGEYGREVFAIPGSIRNPMAQGCHFLIRQGAKLTQSPDDVFVDIASRIKLESPDLLEVAAEPDEPDGSGETGQIDGAQRALLEHMGYDPVGVDTLVERCGLPVAEVASALLVLEMKGAVASTNGLYTRIK